MGQRHVNICCLKRVWLGDYLLIEVLMLYELKPYVWEFYVVVYITMIKIYFLNFKIVLMWNACLMNFYYLIHLNQNWDTQVMSCNDQFERMKIFTLKLIFYKYFHLNFDLKVEITPHNIMQSVLLPSLLLE